MPLKNTHKTYGSIAIFLHWGMGIAIVAMFALGFWMVDLAYYSSWYQTAPAWHKAVGIILTLVLLARLGWKIFNPHPDDSSLRSYERLIARISHALMYVLMGGVMVSGYFISTLDGRSLDMFGLFSLPALVENRAMEKLSGDIHYWSTYLLMGLVVIHALAAFKHHFIDKDDTLKKMLGRFGRAK